MKFILLIVIFLMLVSLMITNNYELHISEKEDFHIFLGVYADWIKIFYSNVKIVTGNVINQNWFPE